jgi:hypothetical protein
MKKNIRELCNLIRTKNAGPFEIGLDLIFKNKDVYQKAKESKQITKELISELYDIPVEHIKVFFWFDEGSLLKITIPRKAAGSPGEHDLYGDQQHVPLLEINVDI